MSGPGKRREKGTLLEDRIKGKIEVSTSRNFRMYLQVRKMVQPRRHLHRCRNPKPRRKNEHVA
jgi:hypothetical protein